jgi:GGDEF domain-containing protein
VVFVLASIPGISGDRGLTSETLLLLATRVLIFGVVGILGGEACGRLRVFFTRATNGAIYDEWSQAFNQAYAYAALTKSIASFERYEQQFTVAVVTLAPSLTSDLGPQRVRNVVRGVAKHLRNDVRMVDEVSLLNDGRFLVLFPNTPVENAKTPATRLARGVRHLLGAKDESVTAQCLGPDNDLPALKALAAQIAPDEGEFEAQSASGE